MIRGRDRYATTSAKRRPARWLALAAALLVTLAAAYANIFYAMYQVWPWTRSIGMSTAILQAAQAPMIAPRPAAQHESAARSLDRRVALGRVTTARASSVATPQAQPSATPTLRHGRMIDTTIDSQIMGGTRPMLVYLPPNYDSTARYPVLYLLHGAPGAYTDWRNAAGIDQTLDAMISVGRLRPMIAVLPDGNGGRFGDTEWANSADGSVRAEDYLVREVVPFIDQHYPTLADARNRAIGGLSTGGFGAANLALHHPDVFGYALSLSGNFVAARTWTGNDLWAGDSQARDRNSPLLLAPHVAAIKGLYFYLCVGNADTADDTLHQTRQFDALLTRLHVPHRAEYFAGTHSWSFWRIHIVDALDYLSSVMPEA